MRLEHKRFESILPPGTLIKEGEKPLIVYPKSKLIDDKERKGVYIVIEGIDGSGKTSVAKELERKLKEKGIEATVVREPWTKEIKDLLNKNPKMNPLTEAYLFAADRMLLHSTVIRNQLLKGNLVIGDRSYIASLVYQVVRGAEENIVYSINSYAIKPDLIVLLDIDPEKAWKRINNKKKKQLQHLEKKELLGKIRERYLEILDEVDPDKKLILNAEKSIEELAENILETMGERGLLKMD